MTKQTPSLLLLVGAIAGGAGFVAFVILMVAGDFVVSPAAFLAIVVALAAAIALFPDFHREGDAADRDTRAPVPGDGTFDSRTIARGSDVIHPGGAGLVAATGAASPPEDDRQTGSAAAIAPGSEPGAAVADAAPTAEAGDLPNGQMDRDMAAETSVPAGAEVDRGGARRADLWRGKVKSGTLLGGEQDLAARKGSWKYQRSPAGVAEAAGDGEAERADAAQAADSPIGVEPVRLSEARDEGGDDLKRIKGVGPKLEQMLHRLGFFHYDQIAAWSDKEVVWVDENLEGFKGRVGRDGWVDQARHLAAGEATGVACPGEDDGRS